MWTPVNPFTFSCVSKVPKELMGLVKVVMASFDDLLGEIGQELKGIAEYWKVDLGLVVGLNFAYEFRRVSVYCAMLLDNVPICGYVFSRPIYREH